MLPTAANLTAPLRLTSLMLPGEMNKWEGARRERGGGGGRMSIHTCMYVYTRTCTLYM